MSFSVAIAIIVLADVALIAGLAFVMSRASRLTPHVSAGATWAATAEPAIVAPIELHWTHRPEAARVDRRPQASAA